MNQQCWTVSRSSYILSDKSSQVDKLPNGLYILSEDPNVGLLLQKVGSQYEFDYKIYDTERPFISRVLKSYKETYSNLGIILTGVKGTGKSVTSKLLCNELGMPVIMVPNNYEGMPSFLSKIKQDVVIFIDEYEKIYDESDNLLSLMDGMLSSEHRRVFLLTTNEMNISSSLQQRPGRVRYVKHFKDLSSDIIEIIVDDLLKYPEYREKCLEFISTLSIITIDLVKAIIQEVNIHNEPPENFKDVFNITSEDNPIVNIYITEPDNKESILANNITIGEPPNSLRPGDNIYIDRLVPLGRVIRREGNLVYLIKTSDLEMKRAREYSNMYYTRAKVEIREEEEEETIPRNERILRIRLEKSFVKHYAY